MGTAATRVAPDKTRKGPTVGAVRPSTMFFNSSTDDHNLKLLRVQRVIADTGVSPVFASIAAPLIYGGAA